ncbi:DNA-binding protein YbaB [Actinoalloteichus hoggarensis]|uniref:Uncharacterized protein n=1 Tax=Actinoalloteichus hoggarensis TaxID=1470176 RepID=A0A221VYU2_9PSEU|nr:YbaB/EbfC family nucleoid-associated protein [Actinoalloteichus hoggarensis]ASO18712.1 hypothetical protein AHOG_05295 [Actinoalloteichus hoggarensis]MBB5919945.1 DNA-binding protein YbaB [Actinoalloteichus hoggarensis]
MSSPSERRAELEGRLSTLKEQAAVLTEQLAGQTEALQAAQEQAAQARGTATSPDGLVTIAVDAAGGIAELRLAPTAFSRSTPERLARSISDTFAAAKAGAQAQVSGAFGSLAQAPMVDLPDVVAGMPSLRGLFETATRPLRPAEDVPGRDGFTPQGRPGQPGGFPHPAPPHVAAPGFAPPQPPHVPPGRPAPPPGHGTHPGRPRPTGEPPRQAPRRRPDDDEPDDEGGSIFQKGNW